jgi:hypothetical protein
VKREGRGRGGGYLLCRPAIHILSLKLGVLMRVVGFLMLFLVLSTPYARSHEVDNVPSKVTISERGDKRVVEANGLPDYKPGRFPNRGNPNEISEQEYRFEMPLRPTVNKRHFPVDRYIFGIALNGVVFDPGTAEVWVPGERIVSRPGPGTRRRPSMNRDNMWNYDGMGRMNLGLDSHHAHVQPNGAYHYHGLPVGLIERLRKEKGDEVMLLVGYAADGFPVYAETGHAKADDASSPVKRLRSSYKMKAGKRPTGDKGPGGNYDGTFVQDYEFDSRNGDLDECNGRAGVTPKYRDGTYYYVLTDSFPFVPRYFRGTPDDSFEKRFGRWPGPPSGFGPSAQSR